MPPFRDDVLEPDDEVDVLAAEMEGGNPNLSYGNDGLRKSGNQAPVPTPQYRKAEVVSSG